MSTKPAPENTAENAGGNTVEDTAGGSPEISYEQARADLRDIVSKLESGGQPLEQSLALWQRGEVLAGICQQWLDGARSRLDAAIAAASSDDGD